MFWDAQNTLIEDIDRIEVISGPGGTFWGANAVNGVINLTTKSAQDTQGLYVEAGAGSELEDSVSVRYGGVLAPGVYFRVYGMNFNRGDEVLGNGSDASDSWNMGQGGFRLRFGRFAAKHPDRARRLLQWRRRGGDRGHREGQRRQYPRALVPYASPTVRILASKPTTTIPP